MHLVTERAAKVLSETVTPAGLVAVCSVPETTLSDVVADGPRLVAVAEEISEPGNAGTLIRIADAMGADAVVLVGHSVDPYNGKCLRASAGSIFSIPVVTEPDAVGAVSMLGEAGLQVLATTVDGEVSLDDAALDARTAWLFGPESHGLAKRIRRKWRRIESGYRFQAAPRASMWRPPPRSVSTKARELPEAVRNLPGSERQHLQAA